MSDDIVRVPIDKARAAGKHDQYASAAISQTETHFRVRASDWAKISGRVLHGAVGAVKAVAGVDRADDQTIALRLAICESCPESLPHDKPVANRHCGKLRSMLKPAAKTCGCRIALKTKVKSESCPLEKW